MTLGFVFGPFSLQGVLYVMTTAYAAWHISLRAGLLTTLLGLAAAQLQRLIDSPDLLADASRIVDRRDIVGLSTYFALSGLVLLVGRRHQQTVHQLEETRRDTAMTEAAHRQQLEAALARERAARRDAEQANQLRQELLVRLSQELARARELAAIVESSEDAIIGTDLRGTIRSWNHAAEALFGHAAAAALGQSIHLIIPAERRAEEQDIVGRLTRGENVVHFETERCHRDARIIPVSLTVSPIRDEQGVVVGASKIARDITAPQRSRRINEYFAELSALLSRHFDERGTLGELVRRTVPFLGDWCAIDLKDSRGSIDRVAAAHADPARQAQFLAFRERYPASPHSPINVRQVMQTRRSLRVSQLTDETLDAMFDEPEYREAARALGIRSFMIVPLLTREHAVGALTLARGESGDPYTEADLQHAEGLASRLALSIDNARAYEAATQANRLKDEFLATLSHELRTPLNAIVGYVRMLNSGVLDGERMVRALSVLDRNTTALTRLVEDVLDVSRFMAGKVRLDLRPLDIGTVLEQVIAATRPASEAKGVRLEAELADDVPPVMADPDRLQQVLWNLLSNAVKFTGRGGRIHVRLGAGDHLAAIVVRDTGCGISPEFLPHAFERFRQGDARFVREHGGLGLGLAIARDLIQLHGGTIQADSPGVGCGATFTVELPLAPPDDENRADPGAVPALVSRDTTTTLVPGGLPSDTLSAP